MADHKIKRALISVYDKTGIVEFARTLFEEFGIEILSTGGTAKLLKENNIPVTLVEDITGWGEMLDGRVKTLHPKIHAAILADRDNPEHMRQLADAGIEPIDMVVVNLYPFEQTVADPECRFEDAIEMIDIGGPCMLRAAAKNHKHVAAVGESAYAAVLKEMRGCGGRISYGWKRRWAAAVFQQISLYDRTIHQFLGELWPFKAALPRVLDLRLVQAAGMRYGENPHQLAGKYTRDDGAEAQDFVTDRYPDEIERTASYNNIVDADAAWDLASEVGGESTCVFVKHNNACGVGVAADCVEAYRRAYLGDPNAAMGGILACSFPVGKSFAETVMQTLDRWGHDAGAGAFFIEVWIAPRFDDTAVKIIRNSKKWGERVRLLTAGDLRDSPQPEALQLRSVGGAVLVQTPDTLGLNEDQWKTVSKRQLANAELRDLRLAWLVAKHTKSNAISICKDGMLIGNGAGQMSRVMSCRIATWLAKENGHADKLAGSAAASDAFFPFRDGPDILADAGVTAIIQPGGSKRDADTIAACDERGIAMIFTGTRHFRH